MNELILEIDMYANEIIVPIIENVIAIRNSLNSSMSTQIIFPVWIATITAALASIITAKVLIRLGK